ncbi:MAG: GreA/GreB family elongation factor [Thermoanaerobaculia bacterium]
MQFSREAETLIESKSWEELESRWMAELERDPRRLDEFLSVAHQLRKADERSRADSLLELLAEALKDADAWEERLTVLREIGRLSRRPASLAAPLEEAVRKALGTRPSFDKVMAAVGFDPKEQNPVEKAEKIQLWLTYDEGEYFFMAGRGPGVVTELNPDLAICRVDFEKQKRVSIPLGAAQKNLIPLPPGHILRDSFERPEELREEVLASPGDAFARLLQSFGRPMVVGEVKDAMLGIVPDARWTSWWTSARKNPRIVTSGKGVKASYDWSATEDDAETSIRREFDQAVHRARVDLAKKHSSRSQELADYFARILNEEVARLADTEPSRAWETLAALEKLPGKAETTIDRDELLLVPMAARVASGISDRNLREKAIEIIRERHPEWPKVFGEIFFMDDDLRILSGVIEALEKDAPEIADRLIDETLRHPRRHPRAFFWFVKTIADRDELSERATINLLNQMLEAIGWEEFSSIRARMRELFDRGGLAVRILMRGDNPEGTRKLIETLERFGSLEEYRRDLLRDAAHMTYPELRAPQIEPIFATAKALAAKKEEFERMKTVEIPETLKAIQVAREMGDLRENFEYKAARQRQEYLSARVAELSGELSRVRVIDPSEVDVSEVRIGTTVSLRNGEVQRTVAILGPWESDPEHGIYSNLSEAAHALISRKAGEVVTFMGNDYVIEGIDRWRD